MLDASFIVLIGFIVFMATALRFGYKKSINALDQKISEVRETLATAEHRKSEAEAEFKKQKKLQQDLKKDIAELTTQTKAQVAIINAQAHDEIERLFANRQNNFELQLERIRNSAIDHLNTTITNIAVSSLAKLIQDLPDETHQTINTVQLDEFERLIVAGSNNSNGAHKKTLKKTAKV